MNYLKNADIDKALQIRQGVFIHSYKDLLIQLKLLSDDEFKKRFGDGREIIEWINKNFRDEELLLKMELLCTRREFIRVVERRIEMLEEGKSSRKRIPEKMVMPFYINVVFFIVFVIVVLSFLRYAYVNDGDSRLKYLEMNDELRLESDNYRDRIIYLENQNARLQDELDSRNLVELETGIPSPTDRIKIKNVGLNQSVVLVQINNSYISEFTDTNSMLPVLNSDAIGIEIIPENESQIFEGDIISYTLNDNSIIIHRVVQVGKDSDGWFAITKGDSNPLTDKEKVRFEQIKGILVGILY